MSWWPLMYLVGPSPLPLRDPHEIAREVAAFLDHLAPRNGEGADEVGGGGGGSAGPERSPGRRPAGEGSGAAIYRQTPRSWRGPLTLTLSPLARGEGKQLRSFHRSFRSGTAN